jgi:hypothetical protein
VVPEEEEEEEEMVAVEEEGALRKANTSATTCTTLSDPTVSTSVLAPTGVSMPALELRTTARLLHPSTERGIDPYLPRRK